MMIFDKLWDTMKLKGVSTYKLRGKHSFNTKTIAKLRQNDNVTTATLNKLCSILDCDISEILEYHKINATMNFSLYNTLAQRITYD